MMVMTFTMFQVNFIYTVVGLSITVMNQIIQQLPQVMGMVLN